MKIIFLGTNGWYSTATGNTICILIDTEKYYIILDAGDGINKLDLFIKESKPIFLFLSHLHLDHIIGFHSFNKFKFKNEMKIFIDSKMEESINRFLSPPFTVPLKKLSFNAEIITIEEGKNNLFFDFESRLLFHSERCLGYKFTLESKLITYCTDTGLCKNLFELSNCADLLITECSYKSGQFENSWPHLNPETAAEVAKKSKVGKLVITHFDANIYRTLKERKRSEFIARKIFKNTIAAYDGLEIKL